MPGIMVVQDVGGGGGWLVSVFKEKMWSKKRDKESYIWRASQESLSNHAIINGGKNSSPIGMSNVMLRC